MGLLFVISKVLDAVRALCAHRAKKIPQGRGWCPHCPTLPRHAPRKAIAVVDREGRDLQNVALRRADFWWPEIGRAYFAAPLVMSPSKRVNIWGWLSLLHPCMLSTPLFADAPHIMHCPKQALSGDRPGITPLHGPHPGLGVGVSGRFTFRLLEHKRLQPQTVRWSSKCRVLASKHDGMSFLMTKGVMLAVVPKSEPEPPSLPLHRRQTGTYRMKSWSRSSTTCRMLS